jgi:uncharacterized protein YdeI (YjbR/CyaY-like superfamily)
MMMKDNANPGTDAFFNNAGQWNAEFRRLRAILSGFPLREELKWGKPTYSIEDGNIALIHGFRDYCALLFMDGALLADPAHILVRQTENVRAARQIRFTGVRQIDLLEETLKAYVAEAIQIRKAGLKTDFHTDEELPLPEALTRRLEAEPALKAAFAALTPGRRRAYALHFTQPKQEKTREARVEKNIGRILAGKGLNDPD